MRVCQQKAESVIYEELNRDSEHIHVRHHFVTLTGFSGHVAQYVP